MNNKINVLNIILISSLTSFSNAELKEYTISEEDYKGLQNLSKLMNQSEDETISIGLKNGTLIIDNNGRILINTSVYDILMNQNLIKQSDASSSTICARTGEE